MERERTASHPSTHGKDVASVRGCTIYHFECFQPTGDIPYSDSLSNDLHQIIRAQEGLSWQMPRGGSKSGRRRLPPSAYLPHHRMPLETELDDDENNVRPESTFVDVEQLIMKDAVVQVSPTGHPRGLRAGLNPFGYNQYYGRTFAGQQSGFEIGAEDVKKLSQEVIVAKKVN
jgi:hypothetical protein